MDASSLEDTLQYDMLGVVSNRLSPQIEVCLQTISLPSPQLCAMSSPISLREAENLYPALFKDLNSRLKTSNTQPYAIQLDTSHLGTQTQGCENMGLVLVLPPSYADQMALICTQKPTLWMVTLVNYRHRVLYFSWKSDQFSVPATHDLWLPEMGSSIVDEAWLNDAYHELPEPLAEERYSWTDVLVVCDEMVVAGGFWTSTSDTETIQVQSYLATNARPHQIFSEEKLAGAEERAVYLNSIAPWDDETCINEFGRRYRTLPFNSKYFC